MPRTEFKAKSGRKALRDLSNNGGRSGRVSKSVNAKNKASLENMEDRRVPENEDGSLDRLMLAQSDLSSLLRQIDELVVQAFKLKGTSKERRKEIESFSNVMSDMLSSLKPWVPRFQKLLSSPAMENANQLGQSSLVKTVSPVKEVESAKGHSPEPSTLDSLISPSPLVSWRNDCHIERGRQIFMLTPLPISKTLSSKHQDSSKSTYVDKNDCDPVVELPSFLNIPEDANDDLLEGVAMKTSPEKHHPVAAEKNTNLQCVSTPMFSKKKHPLLVMTPCLKISPPRSCLLLEDKIESAYHGNERTSKCTPFNFLSHSEVPESSSSEGSEDLTLKYPELLGIRKTYRSGMVKKEVEASPNWLFSPPKSCVLLEPPDEKSLDNVAISSQLPIDSCISNKLRNLYISKENAQGDYQQTNKSFNQGTVGGAIALIESTPTCKEPESTFRTGKRPGENTLKKELWTKFEAVSTYGLRLNASTCHGTAMKGFLDRLDEVSCDEESTVPDGLI